MTGLAKKSIYGNGFFSELDAAQGHERDDAVDWSNNRNGHNCVDKSQEWKDQQAFVAKDLRFRALLEADPNLTAGMEVLVPVQVSLSLFVLRYLLKIEDLKGLDHA